MAKHIQLHFLHNQVLQKLLRDILPLTNHTSPILPHMHKNNRLQLFCLTMTQIKLIQISHEFCSYFTGKDAITVEKSMDSPYLSGPTWFYRIYHVYSTLYCVASVGKVLFAIFVASFRIKWVTCFSYSSKIHCFSYSSEILWRKSVTIKGRPSLRETFGSQCSSCLALVISGFLIWGSSAVLGLNSMVAIGSIVSFTTWKRHDGQLHIISRFKKLFETTCYIPVLAPTW